MIKKIDANKYGVVRYAISSIEDIADLPREVSVGSEAILVNEDGEKKFKLGSDGWVEVVEVKEYDEDKLRDILEDAKVGYGGIEYETLEERLDKDFDNVYSVLDNRTYVEYEGCRITAKDSLNGLQKETAVKGRTLQNLVPMGLFESYKAENWNVLTKECYSFNNGYLTLNCREDGYVNAYPDIGNMFKTNTVYTMVLDLKENTLVRDSGATFVFLTGRDTELFIETINASQIKKGLNVFKLTTHSDLTNAIYIARTFIYNNVTSGHITFRYAIYEGDHTQTPLEELPFIEGIESVGDKSKNLVKGMVTDMNHNERKYVDCEGGCSNRSSIIKLPKGKYSLSFEKFDRSEIKDGAICIWDNTESTTWKRKSSTTKNFEILENEVGITWYASFSTEKRKDEVVGSFIQIEEGTQVTPYEPYYDGYKISGKSCGKNLWKPLLYAKANAECEIQKDKVIVMGKEDTNWNNVRLKVKVKRNTDYFLSFNCDNPNGYISCRRIEGLTLIKDFGRSSARFNSGENEDILFLMHSSLDKAGIHVVEYNNIQLEEATTPTPYEPYKESTYSYILDEPLRSLPNGVCDEIDLEKGVVTRRVGKCIVDGSENWVIDASVENTRFQFTKGLPNAKNSDTRECIISNNFFDMSDISKNAHAFGGGFHYKTNIFLYKDLANETDFKQWLQANPTTIYYELANPITEYLIKDDKFITLPNGVKDEISHNSVLRKVGKVVFDGSSDEKWGVWTVGGENVYNFVVPILNLKSVDGNPLLCNIFKYLSSVNENEEGIYNGSIGRMGLKISKTKLTSGSIDEFRKWLTLNPITVYYELETPYTESINPNEVILDTTYLKSYEPITHITSDNYLLPTIETQVPSDFNAVVLGLKSNNEALASQVMSLRQTNDELETTNREQDDVIDVTLLALDEVYGMIDESEIETMSMGSPMVNVYVKMIKRGIKTLDEVPAKYRAEVEKLI